MSSISNRDSDTSGERDQFINLFLDHQRAIYRYIMSLVGNSHDADDIFQATSQTLWEKFDKFQIGTSFYAWAIRIALNNVLNHRRRQGRCPQLLDSEVLSVVASRLEKAEPRLSLVREALQFCLGLLNAVDHKLILSRYEPDYDRIRVAEELGRPPNSVTKSLARIRKSLQDCIHRRTASADRTESEN